MYNVFQAMEENEGEKKKKKGKCKILKVNLSLALSPSFSPVDPDYNVTFNAHICNAISAKAF